MTFQTNSVQEAIRQARRRLGSDAMLLTSKKISSAGDIVEQFVVTFGYREPAPSQSGERIGELDSPRVPGTAVTNAGDSRAASPPPAKGFVRPRADPATQPRRSSVSPAGDGIAGKSTSAKPDRLISNGDVQPLSNPAALSGSASRFGTEALSGSKNPTNLESAEAGCAGGPPHRRSEGSRESRAGQAGADGQFA